MSKKIIAGLGVVAGLAVTLAPVATFAVGEPRTIVDNLNVQITKSCEFGHDFTEGTDLDGVTRSADSGHATWTTGGVGTFSSGSSSDTATKTMEAGTTDTAFAQTEMIAYCNNATGYEVKLSATNLTSNDDSAHPIVPAGSATIAGFNVASATQSIYNITPTLVSGTSAAMKSGFTSGSEATALAASSNIPFFGNAGATDKAGDKVTVVYGVGIMKTQGAGTYTGSVTYTLTEGQS